MSDKTTQTDLSKRQILRKVGIGVGAVLFVPLIASFSKNGLIVSEAQAAGKKKGGKKK